MGGGFGGDGEWGGGYGVVGGMVFKATLTSVTLLSTYSSSGRLTGIRAATGGTVKFRMINGGTRAETAVISGGGVGNAGFGIFTFARSGGAFVNDASSNGRNVGVSFSKRTRDKG